MEIVTKEKFKSALYRTASHSAVLTGLLYKTKSYLLLFCIRFARNEQYTTGSYGSTIYSMLESLYLIEVAA